MSAPVSIEQHIRDILTAVQADDYLFERFGDGDDPQNFAAGDVIGPANLLVEIIRRAVAERDDRWQRAVGTTLEGAEESAASLLAYERQRNAAWRADAAKRDGPPHRGGA